MEYTALGRTGLRVSRVGCGGGGIGQVWGPTTEAESVRAIHRALELGADAYWLKPQDFNDLVWSVCALRDRMREAPKRAAAPALRRAEAGW